MAHQEHRVQPFRRGSRDETMYAKMVRQKVKLQDTVAEITQERDSLVAHIDGMVQRAVDMTQSLVDANYEPPEFFSRLMHCNQLLQHSLDTLLYLNTLLMSQNASEPKSEQRSAVRQHADVQSAGDYVQDGCDEILAAGEQVVNEDSHVEWASGNNETSEDSVENALIDILPVTIPCGQWIDVTAATIISPGKFWLKLRHTTNEPLDWNKVGEMKTAVCAVLGAYYIAHIENIYVRVRIIEIPETRSSFSTAYFKVHDIDTGREFLTRLNDLYSMDESIAQKPSQAVFCILKGVDNTQHWPTNMCSAFQRILRESPNLQAMFEIAENSTQHEVYYTVQIRNDAVSDVRLWLLHGGYQGKRVQTERQNSVRAMNYATAIPTQQPSWTDTDIPVVVSTVITPENFYIHLNSDLNTLLELSGAMESMYTDDGPWYRPDEEPAIGTCCAAQWRIDGAWYRAEVLGIEKRPLDRDVYRVLFVDFGDQECVSVDQVRPLIASIANIPRLALNVCLANVTLRDESSDWSLATEMFKEVLEMSDKKANIGVAKRKHRPCIPIIATVSIDGAEIVLNEYLHELGCVLFDCPPAHNEQENAEQQCNTEQDDHVESDKTLIKDETKFEAVDVPLSATAAVLVPDAQESDDSLNPMEKDYYSEGNVVTAPSREDPVYAVMQQNSKALTNHCPTLERLGKCDRLGCTFDHTPIVDGIPLSQQELAWRSRPFNKLPEVDSFVRVTVLSVETPNHFYVLVDRMKEHGKNVAELHCAMSKAYENSNSWNKNILPAEGELVAVQVQKTALEGNTMKKWRRGKVISCTDDEVSFWIYLVDEGTYVSATVSNMRPLIPELAENQFLAVECFLNGLGPDEIEDGEAKWSTEAIGVFRECVCDKSMNMHVLARTSSDALIVDLYSGSATKPDNSSLAEKMIQWNKGKKVPRRELWCEPLPTVKYKPA